MGFLLLTILQGTYHIFKAYSAGERVFLSLLGFGLYQSALSLQAILHVALKVTAPVSLFYAVWCTSEHVKQRVFGQSCSTGRSGI